MGKVKNNRKKQNRHNATGMETTSEVLAAEALQPVPVETIMPLMNKLSSPDANERSWAAAGASNLLMHDAATRRLMLSKNLVGALIERLTDSVHEVVVEALGALRNLTVVGGEEVINEMYNKNVLTPVSALIPPLGNMIDSMFSGPATTSEEHEKRKTVWDWAENVISIFWAMSENSEKALKAINKFNLVPFLMPFMTNVDKVPPRVIVAAAQCLYTLTDDNPDCRVHFVKNPDYIKTLMKILTLNVNAEQELLIKTLVCGIVINLRSVIAPKSSEGEGDFTGIHSAVMPVLSGALNYDLQKASAEATAAAEITNAKKLEPDLSKPTQPATPEEQTLAAIETRLQTLQLALELIANICTESVAGVEEEEEEWKDEGGDDDDMEAEDDEENLDDSEKKEDDELDENTLREMEQLAAASNEIPMDLSSHPIINILTSTVFPALISLATPTSLSFPPQEVPTPSTVAPLITAQLSTTHLRAIEALNNFLLTMADAVPGKWWYKQRKADAEQCWVWLFQQAGAVAGKGVQVGAEEKGQEMRGTILDGIVGCLWTLARGLGGEVPLSDFHVPALIGAYASTTSDSMRVKTIGCLGVIARRQGAIETNKVIGEFLISLLKNKPSPEACIEALNAIYDIYADAEFDYDLPVFVQGNFNQELKGLIKMVRFMVRNIDRRKDRDLRNRGDEAVLNLVEFVKYKEKERK
ncbi:armadillo-type protein [Lobosporangium transversale]|uniref:Armadillo-type protein n=1 Tax=Lobosporangium transversale TaxID=64571 RepID=A0A1Y2GW20_9FUNG|nr:armadillo-type protein [Lobosporangium transversale]ORZ26498.1 armadillo-type protein [Lobosporangium transversale]|eukprot:XP_021884263.1 armadillo-type protein [Lobosporangium transversale]